MFEIAIFCHFSSSLTPELQEFLKQRNLSFTLKKYLTIKTELSQLVERRIELSQYNTTQLRVKTLSEIVFNQKQLKERVRMEIKEIREHTLSEIYLDQNELEIIGNVESTRILCLCLLDRLFGQNQESILVPQHLHAIVNGRKRIDLNEIMYKTRTCFYFPICFSAKSNDTNAEDVVYVTGMEDDIKVALEMYSNLVKSVVSFNLDTKYWIYSVYFK